MNKPVSLAQRRAELVELCGLQRGFLAQECEALRAPFSGAGLRGYLGSNRTIALAAAGAVLGLVVVRPKRLLAVATAGLSMWKLARRVLPKLSAG